MALNGGKIIMWGSGNPADPFRRMREEREYVIDATLCPICEEWGRGGATLTADFLATSCPCCGSTTFFGEFNVPDMPMMQVGVFKFGVH